MRVSGRAARSRKRRSITRRDRKAEWRRGAQRRVWVGSRARLAATRPLFFGLSAQQVRRPRPADWLGAAAMVLSVASWGVLAALLAA